MVNAFVWSGELDIVFGTDKKVGGNGDVVVEESDEGTLDG